MNAPLPGLAAVLAFVVLVMGLLLLAGRGTPRIAWNRAKKVDLGPVPEQWAGIIREWFPLSRTLEPGGIPPGMEPGAMRAWAKHLALLKSAGARGEANRSQPLRSHQ